MDDLGDYLYFDVDVIYEMAVNQFIDDNGNMADFNELYYDNPYGSADSYNGESIYGPDYVNNSGHPDGSYQEAMYNMMEWGMMVNNTALSTIPIGLQNTPLNQIPGWENYQGNATLADFLSSMN